MRPLYRNHVSPYDFVVGPSLTSGDVLATLTGLFAERGLPAYIRSESGPKLTSEVVRDWLRDLGVKTLSIEPGSQ